MQNVFSNPTPVVLLMALFLDIMDIPTGFSQKISVSRYPSSFYKMYAGKTKPLVHYRVQSRSHMLNNPPLDTE
jgi:hypothetical protein